MRVVGCRYLAGRLVNGQRGICRSGFWEIKKKKKEKKISQAQIIHPFIEQDEKKER